MKTLVFVFALISGSALAQSLDATEILTSIIPVGTYSGTFEGERCQVSVQPTNNGIMVSASNSRYTRRRHVEVGSTYKLDGGNYFLSSTSYGTNDGFNENILMTRAHNNPNKQYVVVSDRVVVTHETFEYPVECIISLKRN